MAREGLVLFALFLSGCSADFRFGLSRAQPAPIVVPAGDKVIETPDETVIEPAVMCQARARHFVGTVSVPCVDIARETRP
jgi:hypothetical protein